MAELKTEDLLKRIEELEKGNTIPLNNIPQGPSSKLDSDTVDGYQVSPYSSISPNTLVPVGTDGKLPASVIPAGGSSILFSILFSQEA